MSRVVFATVPEEQGFMQQFDRINYDNMIKELAGEGVTHVTTENAFTETMPTHNTFFVSSGKHQGLTITKPQTALWGAAGARITRVGLIQNHTYIHGLYFVQEEDLSNVDHLVVVSGNARVVFSSCIFQRKYNAPVEAPAPTTTKCFVLVEAGSSASFSNCVFRSQLVTGAMNGVGTVIQNANGAASQPPWIGPTVLPAVFVGGGSNMTTHAHGLTVTSLGGNI